jgi:hypothetical protein
VVMVQKSECVFIGDEVDVEFVVFLCFFALWVRRYGIEVSFCTYEECKLRAR